MNDELKYPIGKFDHEIIVTESLKQKFISDIEELPELLKMEVAALNREQLDTPYRIGGWTIRQVVHHLPDSHMNGYIRFKLALTDNNPDILTYKQNDWAELGDSVLTPVEVSMALLDYLHRRWVILIRSLTADMFDSTFYHPEWGETSIKKALALYSWHGRHHLTQITDLKKRMDW